ncbi:hypothetical protein BGZ63DRAFT_456971 [Mariannaea sp. PMI_226]|nr:hypothetical protein BGZ63DRAFT_456971 [Mariannaea sp. PMI_226]
MAPLPLLLPLALLIPHIFAGPLPLLSRQFVTPEWQKKQCTQKEITDASYLPEVRWASVNSTQAWADLTNSWNNDAPGADQIQLPFPEFASNFFNGPEHMNCQDIGDTTCSAMIECDDTNHPAGYLILNSFASLHQIHQTRYNSLNTALNLMQSQLGPFTDTFSPQIPDNLQILKDLISAFVFVAAFGSSYTWNSLIKNAKIFADDNWRLTGKDIFNGAITYAAATARDHEPDPADMQNDLNSAMGTFVKSLMNAEVAYVSGLFQGSFTTLGLLDSLIANGLQGYLQTELDLASITTEAQHIIYTQMIPLAWKLAPGGYYPFILVSDNECSSTAEGNLKGYISDDTAAQTHVCYDGKIFYVVTPSWKIDHVFSGQRISDIKINGLPGGSFNELHGGSWAGTVLDDFVISAWDAYKLNGNKNGYQMPDDSKAIDGNGGEGDLIFQNGVRTPGFTKLPICDINTALTNIQKGDSGSQYFPCN